MTEGKKTTKRLHANKSLRKIITDFYADAHRAKAEGRPVGWIPPMNGLIELFYSMDIHPIFPENWAPICAAIGTNTNNFAYAEKKGYSGDLCGYFRNNVGYALDGIQEANQPLDGLPKPDFLISFGAGCIPTMKTFQVLCDHFRVPVFRADLPQIGLEDIKDHHIQYGVIQIKRLIKFLEDLTGRKFDIDRLRQAVAYTDEACRIWDEIMDARRAIPSPFSAAEIGIMFVMVTRHGTKIAVDFLQDVLKEVREKVERGEGVIPNERIRLFWDNIPLWYNMKLFNYFEKWDAVVVAETYTSAWTLRMNPDKPLESIAYKSLVSYPLVSCVSLDKRIELIKKAVKDYKIDGAIFHSNRSCKPISMGQMDIMKVLSEELNVPGVMFDGDHMDAGKFSMAQFQTRIDAFMEMLSERKRI
ncbi:MAG: 2-hydroxyacyl-CoA dehydratase [Desulfobacteraceae bacterium]|nr:MAG: 2-hydroxyacyl-CoA dehydratase [Desulfobacteraceae bacterium]